MLVDPPCDARHPAIDRGMGMIAKRKLHHAAAGLLGKFMSRNNDYQGYWALGVLYTEARVSGMRVELDLLHGQSLPEAPACISVARSYTAFLRTALTRQGLAPDMLSSATISLAFCSPAASMPAGGNSFGDPVECILTIVERDGRTVTLQSSVRCAAHDSPMFRRAAAMRVAGFRLHQHVIAADGCRALDRLRDAYTIRHRPAFDLLRECAVPPHPTGDAVARLYAARLRALLGEWMHELGAAEVRLRFSTFPRFPGTAVFAEIELVARDGYAVWHNGGADILPGAPHQEAP
jgi:hypothetical protein